MQYKIAELSDISGVLDLHYRYHAHTRKLGLKVIQEFEFNNNSYHKLVYDTSKNLKNKVQE